ncbi:bacterial transcriptional activator domain-containing protein [Mycobacterium xenopi]|uniref:bacterial transcriptional activator domain-containing protein n=1 Tax=Mycobacterium xenopi TaxID=1789 RepID=UPI000A14A380|nr:bacterial transcriptional activator domain-containing protein [Mycobacterium xenopi]ORX14141.1 hypothetical protein AWC32_14255 [Mycobacterium xenopi]SPX94855.1 Uncharacterised protein [Mycobacterium xenopi]
MVSTAVSSAPVTSWWYGQGRAVDVVRRLESLSTLSPPPGPAGVVTARRNDLAVTFVEGLKAPLPQPWQPAGAREARIGCDVVDPGNPPDPDHPVYLVVLGTTDEGALVALNLAAFSRIRIQGDPATATGLVSRWVLELLASHPAITIGVTADVWRGPLTARVQPVTASHIPDVDVLVCGAALSYAERAQIVAGASSPILLDLGQDAAVSTLWAITCGPDRLGQISRGPASRPMTATLIVPSADVVDRCADLLVDHTTTAAGQPAPGSDDGGDGFDSYTSETDTDPQLPALDADEAFFGFPDPPATANPAEGTPAPAAETNNSVAGAPAQDAQPAGGAAPAVDPDAAPAEPEVPVTSTWWPSQAIPESGADAAPPDAAAPVIAPIWNRILGQVVLQSPHSTQQPGPREKRLNELTVFLQHHPWASSSDIIRCVYGGAASEKTVTQQLSMLRARLGVIRPGGPKALPPMSEGGYRLDPAVRSDWMEFERLVEILVETTPTPNLVAAMDLVTGPPLGGIPPKEWAWTTDLRDELRDRVPGAAVVLARRHHDAKRFATAVDIARKGLWYDNARQDLWEIALGAALAGHDKDAFRALRGQFLNTIPGPERDPAVFDLTARAG